MHDNGLMHPISIYSNVIFVGLSLCANKEGVAQFTGLWSGTARELGPLLESGKVADGVSHGSFAASNISLWFKHTELQSRFFGSI